MHPERGRGRCVPAYRNATPRLEWEWGFRPDARSLPTTCALWKLADSPTGGEALEPCSLIDMWQSKVTLCVHDHLVSVITNHHIEPYIVKSWVGIVIYTQHINSISVAIHLIWIIMSDFYTFFPKNPRQINKEWMHSPEGRSGLGRFLCVTLCVSMDVTNKVLSTLLLKQNSYMCIIWHWGLGEILLLLLLERERLIVILSLLR